MPLTRMAGALAPVALLAATAAALHAQRPRPAAGRVPPHPPAAAPAPAAQVTRKTTPAAQDGRTSGVYRVVVTGFTVQHETYDDLLQLDGKRDEVYVSTEVAELDRAQHTIEPMQGVVVSRVFGDVGGMFGGRDGHNGRVQAGSASAAGGLRTGDSYPTSTPWALAGTPSPDRLPMEVWRGTLTRGENAVLITPTLWEFDDPDLREAYRNVNQAALQTATELSSSSSFEAFVAQALDPQAALVTQIAPLGYKVVLGVMDAIGKMGDRPIGLRVNEPGSKPGELTFKPRTLLLNFDNVEHALGGSSIGGKGPGVVTLRFQENDTKLSGDYTLYLLIERVR